MTKSKKSIICVVFICFAILPRFATAQPKPAWTNGVFYSSYYSDVKSFEASGATEDEARNKAAARVIEWKSGATGLSSQVKFENNMVVVTGSDKITVKARVIAEYCERLRNEYRVYLLVQIAHYPTYEFDDIRHILEKINNPYFAKGRNNYLAWGILDASYPLAAGTSFAGRHGGIVGVGYYLNLGADIAGIANEVVPFHYQAGIKFFPYRSFFLSAGYGTLGSEKMNTFNDSEGLWRTEGWRQGEGMIFLAGCDMLGNLNGGGIFFSASAGVSQDMFTKKLQPLVNIKLGIAWGL